MEFDKPYSRESFVSFLRKFLPEDATLKNYKEVVLSTKTHFTSRITELGEVESLSLKIYEIKHKSTNDARVGLSKDAFKILSEEGEERALVIFVPEDSNDVYRFSFVELTLEGTKTGAVRTTYSNPRRYSYKLGKGISYHTPNKYLNQAGRVTSAEDLKERFSVDVLTKEFYSELSDWYAWAIKVLKFPNKLVVINDQEAHNHESAIRLITRLIFVWFLKQRDLIPNEFFEESYLSSKLLKNFSPNAEDLAGKSWESIYYKAILQNLFFAMLNCPLTEEGKTELTMRRFGSTSDSENVKLMKHQELFKDPEAFVNLANSKVPFLNGGLFECLDDKDNCLYLDAFSDDPKINSELIVPDYLFFGEEAGKNLDLSTFYGDSKKKKVSARGLIDILKRYNFTVEENTPFDQDVSLDPELLGKVFENLLAAYNPETQTSARKQTGSFYTPREIVQFMVNESLISYLNRTVGKELEPEFRKLVQIEDSHISLTEAQQEKIIGALFNCKILDPACGSGAFPVGMLQQMVHILQKLDPSNDYWKKLLINKATNESSKAYEANTQEERSEMLADIERSFNESLNLPDYARKLYLIENSIFGVDIQPIAIQIAKLRFFISLVVDQKISQDPIKNFGIRPLPNLEAKFVSADTLKALKKHEEDMFDININEIKKKEESLKLAKHKIFGAKSPKTKRKYKQEVNKLRKEIATLLLENKFVNNEEAEELAAWDMFDQNSCAPFFDPEWMFGIKKGFDIVLGNPPYIQLQANKGALASKYEGCGFEAFTRTGDIYCLFYNRGLDLLCENGALCYITSNKWMRAGYGEKLRKFLKTKSNPILLLDFGGIQVFESATVDTNILLTTKAKYLFSTKSLTLAQKNLASYNNLSDFVQHNYSVCDFDTSDAWVILNPLEQSIKIKIESIGTPLKDWDIQINYGIKTGLNEAFIISTEKKAEILSNCRTEEERRRTDELIRPILRGRDIKRNGYEWKGLYLIWIPWHFPFFQDASIKGASKKAEREFLKRYPALFSHLEKHKQKLSSRNKAETGIRYEWYALQRWGANYSEEFSKPKVVYTEISLEMKACLIPKNWMINNKLYMITSDSEPLEYICEFLNSKIFSKVIMKSANFGGGKGADFLGNVKLPKATQNFFEYQKKDEFFYKVFNLSKEEINFIELQ